MKALGLAALTALATACGAAPTSPAADAGADDAWRPTAACDCDVGALFPDGAAPADVATAGRRGCEAFHIEPSTLRVPAGWVGNLQAVGGSGAVTLFHARDPAALGDTQLSLSGAVLAGRTPVRFEVVAEDGVCDVRATAQVEVLPAFQVEPAWARVRPGGVVRYRVVGAQGPLRWTRVAGAADAGVFDASMTTFTAGARVGAATWIVRDDAGAQEASVTVDIAEGEPLRPRVNTLLVPTGQRVRLDWEGGSTSLEVSDVDTPMRRAVSVVDGAQWFDATGLSPGATTVTVVDRATDARASVRVVVGQALAANPAVRGENLPSGALAWGDFNGDGALDLAVGHPTMHGAATYGGRVAVHLAGSDGAVRDATSAVYDGARDLDMIGQSLAVADVTDDGVDDLIVASPERDLHRVNVGSIEVYPGGPDGTLATPAQALLGSIEGERFGSGMLVADVVGDALPDLVVVAPGARGPAIVATPCAPTGRVFIHLGAAVGGRPFDPSPWQTLELFVPDHTASRCHDAEVWSTAPSPALFDVDGDGALDLAVGLPKPLASDRVGALGQVIVYRGLGRMGFERRPAWVLELADAMNVASMGAGVEVVNTPAGDALMVRAPMWHRNPTTGALTEQIRGAVFAFATGAFARTATVAAPQFVTTALARARLIGELNDALGASAAVGDQDGDGRADYLVGGWIYGLPTAGQVWTFPNAAIAAALRGGPLVAEASVRGQSEETLGSALAVRAASMGRSGAVAVGAALRTTSAGYRTGGVDVLAPSSDHSLTSRWNTRRALTLPQRGGGDAFGTSVTLGALSTGHSGDLVVGAPLAHAVDGTLIRMRAGAARLFAQDASTSTTEFHGAYDYATLGEAVAVLDFDGDGRSDIAVGDPVAAAGGWEVVRRGAVAPPPDARCFLAGTGSTPQETSAPGRGLVRVYTQQPDGRFVERFDLYGAEPAAERGRRGGFGQSLANAGDVNGDGRDDLLVMHAIARGQGAEVVLGRAVDTMGRVSVACGDPGDAPWWPARDDGTGYTSVAGVGDLDRDGCADAVAGVGGGSSAAVAIRFGFGAQCRAGHATPFDLTLIADASRLANNVVGAVDTRADDDRDRPLLVGMGDVVAGPGDVTGDGVPDVLVRDRSWALGDGSDPAVEVISGALLVGLCRDRVCPQGRTGPLWADGAYRRVALQDVTGASHVILRSPESADARFGASLGGADLDGDGVRDVLVGVPDSGIQRARGGAVMAWRGAMSGDTLRGDPWMLAVGDATPGTRFGAAVSARTDTATPGTWIAVGAPAASREGPATGAAYRWFVPR